MKICPTISKIPLAKRSYKIKSPVEADPLSTSVNPDNVEVSYRLPLLKLF